MIYALALIGTLFLAGGFLTVNRIARYKASGLSTIGTAFLLARYVIQGDQYWAGVFTVTLLLLASATVSYYRKARKAGDAA
ncbi:hypothetical protein [Streptomyces sp. 2133.1]|uniref:hypothetical protein n=1 Tax=Streptomyces sp. 2133.1 TaxID=1881021 RepID=UPI0008957F72|nr:hypothetical protein [Streptomyces sp. 2133.1]SEE48592.1 hypothetical protein SAMN05428940_7259 [Streptomyces sp. 2133.1]